MPVSLQLTHNNDSLHQETITIKIQEESIQKYLVSENTNPIWLFSDCLGISIVKMTDTEKNSFESFDQLETVSQFMACDICLEASVFTGRKFPPHSWRV